MAFRAEARVFFDITDILQFAVHRRFVTGIQRVALRIIGNVLATSPPGQVSLIAFDEDVGRFVELKSDWCTPDYDFDADTFRAACGLGSSHSRWSIQRRYAGKPLKKAYHLLRAAAAGRLHHQSPAQVQAGDSYVNLGAAWGMPALAAEMTVLRKAGVKLFPFLHDVVPLKFPEHVPSGLPTHFRTWLDHLYGAAEVILVNSRNTGRDVIADQKEHGRPAPVTVVPLAHEFLQRTATGANIRPEILRLVRNPFVMCVGTIEPRKNVWGSARIWKKVIEDLGFDAPRLLFVGKRGWLTADFDQLLAATKNLAGYVQIVEDASDEELAFLYGRCLFTLYPSLYEGWGLPVGESLWFGKTCVTSNVSSLPEVGGDLCSYAEPGNLQDLYSKVAALIRDPALRASYEARIRRSDLRTWADVAADVMKAVSGAPSNFRSD